MTYSIQAVSLRVLIAATALICAAAALGQSHLVPEEKNDGPLAAYEADLATVLREAFTPSVVARALVLPSFEPEYAVGLRKNADGYELFSVTPASTRISTYMMRDLIRQGHAGSFALNMDTGEMKDRAAEEFEELGRGLPADPADLPLSQCAVKLDAAIAVELLGAWKTMLEEVRPVGGPQGGIDGVTYRFFLNRDGGALTGETWSPRKNSRPATLARIAETMRDYCRTQDRRLVPLMLTLARKLRPRPRQSG
jgi:hypothetical protein